MAQDYEFRRIHPAHVGNLARIFDKRHSAILFRSPDLQFFRGRLSNVAHRQLPAELAAQCTSPHLLAEISEYLFDIANLVNQSFGASSLLSRQVRTYPRGEDRERTTRARQAAEALFTAKPPVSTPAVPETTADQSARKPRILRVTSPPPTRVEEIKAPASPEPAPTPSIPPAHLARIRTWVKYGMTIPQVAAVYGVEVGEIEHLLRKV